MGRLTTSSFQDNKIRIGVLGGTFNPPHMAHLILAAEAVAKLGLDCLLFVLTQHPPHKRDMGVTSLGHRLDMLEAAIEGNKVFSLSRVEIDRPGPHYAVDTVHLLQSQYPGSELIYIMGEDSLQDLPTWHRARDFVAACHALGVMRRSGNDVNLDAIDGELTGVSKKVQFIDAPVLEIASTDIRQRIAEGRPYRYLVPSAVYHIIEERGLYQQAAE
jgi:nicotinate-nucleotide adenylyltransferase